MSVMAVLMHTVWLVVVPAEVSVTVLSGVTVIVPVAFTDPQPPVSGIVYGNTPDTVGVPLMVITLAAQEALTPAGSPTAAPMSVAPVVAIVIGVSAVLIHSDGFDDGAPAVLSGVTSIVPVAVIMPQPPVRVTV